MLRWNALTLSRTAAEPPGETSVNVCVAGSYS